MLHLPFPDKLFDFAVTFNVIYHGTLADVRAALSGGGPGSPFTTPPGLQAAAGAVALRRSASL